MAQTDSQLIETFLTRGIEHVYPSKEIVKTWFLKGEPLTMYLGIDPTGPTLHLGHAIILRKMRHFQDMGHKIILLIGDFTGLIGDPTDKSATRVRQTKDQVFENAKLYKEQAAKIIRFDGDNPAELRYNSSWLAKLTFEELVELAAHFTVQQMLERDMFDKRLQEGRPIYLHEFFYPLMQGYDSVAMDVDGEIGGNDQIFNMLAGRTLLKEIKQKEKFVIGMKLLVDPTGKKMGKSEGNMITFKDSADEMFGKIMGWTDGMILPGFELLTSVSLEEIEVIRQDLENGKNPREVKAELARYVVSFFFDNHEAQTASDRFDKIFQKHEIPQDIQTLFGGGLVIELLEQAGFASSKSDARRLIKEQAVQIDGVVVSDIGAVIEPAQNGTILQKGKRFFVRIMP
ncbi:tyrosine--tRNA ligase [Candidatus Uhrbacteria bacterium CG_4_9_14_3_um_filter_36_7]|uniref:Tyrosine--tRNA ligase n=1 Tax=Candidatus Uhrbacteria bacterium CG_4_9_14_3_um_filter_36_7 TaxID=1975033 RepID=A0A2M7XIA0_9BACT|nr:MAG: tyrosine--tRNA ligase [Candidatus Uhrbacteria bacterium CG_4_9_14_3_um_filter_36_7]